MKSSFETPSSLFVVFYLLILLIHCRKGLIHFLLQYLFNDLHITSLMVRISALGYKAIVVLNARFLLLVLYVLCLLLKSWVDVKIL